MKTLEHLATGNTTTSDAQANFLPTKWSDYIIQYSNPLMYFEQLCIVNNELVGKDGSSIRVPIRSNNLTFTATTSESTARTMTKIDNLTTVLLEPSLFKYGATLSEQYIIESRVDMIKEALDQLVKWRALAVDTAVLTELETASTNQIYGGDATSDATLATGDVMTTELVAKARRYLRDNDFGMNEAGSPEMVLVINPKDEEQFLKDSQFVNAAEYGSNEIILNGEIGKLKYIGVRVLVTTRLNDYTNSGDSWGVDGHRCVLVDPGYAAVIAWKMPARFDKEWMKDEGMWKFYLDMMFDVKLGQDKAIVLIDVTDA